MLRYQALSAPSLHTNGWLQGTGTQQRSTLRCRQQPAVQPAGSVQRSGARFRGEPAAGDRRV